jgi:hypothetical protein
MLDCEVEHSYKSPDYTSSKCARKMHYLGVQILT